MIKKIAVENFKCFNNTQEIPLSPINIFYGKNGRGKSTVIQILLLLAQTVRETNDVRNLFLMGNLVKLGTFNELLNVNNKKEKIEWNIEDDDKMFFSFKELLNKTQLASLDKFIVNGINRFDEQGMEIENDEDDKQTAGCGMMPISDISFLQNLKNLQYISADRFGPTNFSPRIDSLDPDMIGVKGEYLINVLANQGKDFLKQVTESLSEILSGASLKVTDNGADYIELFINSVNGETVFRPINVGFGYSYVLPVIVAALLAKEKSILIVENPEAHLHPGAQSRIMKFLIKMAKEKDLQLFIETHSDHVVNGMRIAMKQKYMDIVPDDGEIVFFAHDSENTDPEIEIIKCDSEGELSVYPDDFLDEWSNQLIKLL